MVQASTNGPGIWRDQLGTSVVELAVCCPFLVLLLSGLIDLGLGMAERHRLQKAVNMGLEIIQTNPPQIEAGDATYDYSEVRTETAAAAGVPVEAVVASRWLECDGVRQQADAVCLLGQRSARFFNLQISKPYLPQLLPQQYVLKVSAAVRTQ